jgi:protein-tyrosine phosphatase
VLGVDPDYLRTALDEMKQKYSSIEGYFGEGLGIDTDSQHELRDTLVGS